MKPLYQINKDGSINIWYAWAEGSTILTEYGKMYGKMIKTVGKVCIATNVGKANSRTPEQQAQFEVESLYKEKIRKGYAETLTDAAKPKITPMLAEDAHKIKFSYPVYVQPKFDGLRCLHDNDTLISRGNKTYELSHIKQQIKALFGNIRTDGELYVHGESLQTINSLVRKQQEKSSKVKYYVYDIPSDLPWNERVKQLSSYANHNQPNIVIVPTILVNNEEQLKSMHDKFVSEGYEGAMIRTPEGLYEYGNRSQNLLKYKSFEDKEFKIIGIQTGTGKMEGCAIFLCKNDINEKTFLVVPDGTMEYRKSLNNLKNVGKQLTVKFKGRSEDGIPKIATGKSIRDGDF